MKINKSTVLIGSDFEEFLMDQTGKIISAIPFIDAGKRYPEQTDRKGCCIQHDGVLSECNVPPVKIGEATEFWGNVKFVRNYIYEKFAKKENLTLMCCPSAELEDDQLQHPEALESGCSPSYNAWKDGEMNQSCGFEGSPLRTCGAHVHFSFEGANADNCIDLMKCFDVFLTIPSLFMDNDEKRRQFYGKAGEMRLCDWGDAKGFEARTLSNFWLQDEELVEWIFNQIELMFDYYNEHGMDQINAIADDVIEAINTSNKEKAGEICDKFNLLTLISESIWTY